MSRWWRTFGARSAATAVLFAACCAGSAAADASAPAVSAGARPLAATRPLGTAAPRQGTLPSLAAASPFEPSDGGSGSSDGSGISGVERSPSTARLNRVAAALRTRSLVVDPELDWILDERAHRALQRRLDAARIPVFVAVLPSLDEDESGGDTERVLQTLQRRLGRDGLYVVVDQDGRMDLASLGVPLDLGIPYSLLTPSFADRRPIEEQAREPAPPGWTTISTRIGGILEAVAQADPGPPNAVIDDVDALEPLAGNSTSAREREDTIAASVTGTLLGLTLAALILGVGAAARSTRASRRP